MVSHTESLTLPWWILPESGRSIHLFVELKPNFSTSGLKVDLLPEEKQLRFSEENDTERLSES